MVATKSVRVTNNIPFLTCGVVCPTYKGPDAVEVAAECPTGYLAIAGGHRFSNFAKIDRAETTVAVLGSYPDSTATPTKWIVDIKPSLGLDGEPSSVGYTLTAYATCVRADVFAETPGTTTDTSARFTGHDLGEPSERQRKATEEQQQQRERTNRGNKDDAYTEGNVAEVVADAQPPYVIIANRDGLVRVNLHCSSQCPRIVVGDYLTVEGTKQTEQLFDAETVSVER